MDVEMAIEVEEAGTRKTGILDPLPLFQEIAPGVSPPLAEVTPTDSSFTSHMGLHSAPARGFT